MFNLFKVASLLPLVPHFTPINNNHITEIPYNDTEEGDFQFQSYHPNIHLTDSPPESEGKKEGKGRRSVEKRGDTKESKKKDKKDDDDNNNNGGFLEPIIEDLQGFLKGKRSPVPVLWMINQFMFCNYKRLNN